MQIRYLFVLAMLVSHCSAQRTTPGVQGSPIKVPASSVKTSATLPSTCSIGDIYYKTGASAGLYACSAANTWTASGGGANGSTYTIEFVFDGGGAKITTNAISYKRVPVASHIVGWAIEAVGSSPAITIDVLGQAAATTLPTLSIAAAALPSVAGVDKAKKSTILTGWTVALTADYQLAGKVTIPGNATWALLTIYLTVD